MTGSHSLIRAARSAERTSEPRAFVGRRGERCATRRHGRNHGTRHFHETRCDAGARRPHDSGRAARSCSATAPTTTSRAFSGGQRGRRHRGLGGIREREHYDWSTPTASSSRRPTRTPGRPLRLHLHLQAQPRRHHRHRLRRRPRRQEPQGTLPGLALGSVGSARDGVRQQHQGRRSQERGAAGQ